MKQLIIKSVFFRKIFNINLSIIAELKPLTLGFVVATLLCNYQQAIAQTPNPSSLPPDRLEDIPVTPLPSDVLPQPSEQEQLLPPQLPETQIPRQDDIDAKFQVDRNLALG